MNDLLTLESAEVAQGGAKFQLQGAVKSEESVKEKAQQDAESQPELDGTDPLTSASAVGTTRVSNDTSADHLLQASMVTPLIVLSTNACGDFEASVLVDPPSSVAGAAPWSSLQFSSLHSLAQANLISDTQQQIAKQLSAQGEEHETESQGKKRKKSTPGVRSGEKSCPTKVKFVNDLRKDLQTGVQADLQKSPKKQIAIFEPQPCEPKTFVCKVKGCGRQFAWQAHFKYHQLTHTNDRRFVCEEPECGKRFLTAQRLQVHKRTHTGERPFVCQAEDCGKSFTTAGNLKNHSRVHTGERPFACDIDGCGRRFAEYSSLHKHSLTHSGAKPFSCEICGKCFSQSGSRRVHMNRHKLEEDKAAAAQGSGEAEDADDGATGDDSDFKPELSVKVARDSVLCSSHEDNLHYQDLQNAESVVFSQGLTDHIVTVTTQPTHGEAATLEMSHDMLGAEEVLVDEHMSDGQERSSVVVLSQPSHMDSLHHPALSHTYPLEEHKVMTQSVQSVEYDHSQLLHSHLHHEEIATSHHHVLAYQTLDPSSQHSHDAQTVAEEIEVSVSSSSSSHPQSGQSIHMDPMMESDDEYDVLNKEAS